ncbi:hypothetical protein [Streptomyces sp. NPDC059753]|uniref:hypothetical protein n=1 Tax=Streptomyces sp. NPDC059753 TaxID=3346933 RepID=UPI0036620FAC
MVNLDHRDADVGHGHAHAHTREEVRSGKATTDGSAPVGEPAADAALGGLDGAVDATLDMRIAERAVSAVLRRAADEVPGVQRTSACLLLRHAELIGARCRLTGALRSVTRVLNNQLH